MYESLIHENVSCVNFLLGRIIFHFLQIFCMAGKIPLSFAKSFPLTIYWHAQWKNICWNSSFLRWKNKTNLKWTWGNPNTILVSTLAQIEYVFVKSVWYICFADLRNKERPKTRFLCLVSSLFPCTWFQNLEENTNRSALTEGFCEIDLSVKCQYET